MPTGDKAAAAAPTTFDIDPLSQARYAYTPGYYTHHKHPFWI